MLILTVTQLRAALFGRDRIDLIDLTAAMHETMSFGLCSKGFYCRPN